MQLETTIRAIVETDATAEPETKRRILAALDATKRHRRKIVPLSTREAADLLNIHVVTLRRWEKEGRVTPIRLSARKIRWDRNQLEDLMNGLQEAG